MSIEGSGDRFMSDINVTPFVDVMLVLLIIFMVTAPMMMQGVNVDLPKTTNAPLPAKEEALIVSIKHNGKVFISNYEVSVDMLHQKLKKILENRQSREVFLNADKTVPYGIVVRVMSEIKAAGVDKLGMVTQPVDQDKTGDSKTKAD